MDGRFRKQKVPFLMVILLGSGIYDVFIFGRMLAAVGFSAGKDSVMAVMLQLSGVVLCAVCVRWLSGRRKVRLRIEDNHISGVLLSGKKLEIDFSEIEYAEAGRGVLTITLKNGKAYMIAGLQNEMELCDYILRGIEPLEKMGNRETLEKEIRELKEMQGKAFVRLCGSVVLWFADILVCVMLTGKKDFSEYTGREWIIFGVFMGLLLAMVVATFVMANRVGKRLRKLPEKRRYLRKILLESEPLGKGKCRRILADDTAQIRVIFYGYPNAQDAYLTVEAIDRELRLCCVYESPIYSSTEEMLERERLPRPLDGMRVIYSE